jgi:hypothetical protein
MAYVGTPIDTRNQFQSLQGKRFNGDGSTTDFTLDVAPSSTLDIEVFVGNVRQDPNSAYTLSGTTLTFTGAPPSGTNNIYVVHQAKAVGTIDPPATETVAKQFNGGVVFNEDSADLDFRVESNGNANMLVVNGGGDRVGVASDPDLGTGLHIKTADSGASVSVNADELVIEGSANSGLSILSGASSNGRIMFGDSGDNDIGYIEYDHGANQLALGANAASHIKIDSAGHVTMPNQSAFLTHLNDTQDVNSTNTTEISYNTEIFDLNADYNTSTRRFTAPVTGKYMLHAMARVVNADSNSGGHYVQVQIVTSNRTYTVISGVDLTYWNINNSVLCDMDASDTAYVQIKSSNDTSWAVSGGAGESRFCGYLVA